MDSSPPRLAVDADGYCWRVYPGDSWSMCPVNPDNSPIPRPVTFYDPVFDVDDAELELCLVCRVCGAVEDDIPAGSECPSCGAKDDGSHSLAGELGDARVVFGLRAQGHLETVRSMLAGGCSWTDIGRAIGWDGATAERFYELEVAAATGRPVRESVLDAERSLLAAFAMADWRHNPSYRKEAERAVASLVEDARRGEAVSAAALAYQAALAGAAKAGAEGWESEHHRLAVNASYEALALALLRPTVGVDDGS